MKPPTTITNGRRRRAAVHCMAAMLATLPLLTAQAGQPAPQTATLAMGDGALYTLNVRSLKAARYSTTVHQQYDFSCGSAALATLLTYHYGHPVSEQDVFRAMWAQGDQQRIRREGFSLLDMKHYLGTLGFTGDGYALPLDKLVAAGYPAIVLVTEQGYQHFVVVKGVDGGRVLLGDPASGTRALSRADFEARWSGRLLFVIHGWQGRPQFNQGTDWQAAPHMALGEAVDRRSLELLTLAKNGSGNF